MNKLYNALVSRGQKIRRSSIVGAVLEARVIAEAIRYCSVSEKKLAEKLPAGDGRPVMVIPGFLCGDPSTYALRRFLSRLGYRSLKWKQGINWGPQPGVRTRLLHRVNEIQRVHKQPVTLVGWSLGGYYARELACIRPDLVREVITLGSPLMQGTLNSTAVWYAFVWLNQRHMPQLHYGELDFPQPRVPCLSIYTRDDGIVPWECCVPPRGHAGDCVQVPGSHIGLIANPEVMRLLATRLGSPRPVVDHPERRRRRQLRRSRAAFPSGRKTASLAANLTTRSL